MPDKYWDDFEKGFTFKTPSITVTETHIVTWAGLTMDFYPLHMDKEFAARTPMKERVAHGPLIFGMAVGMAGLARVEGGSIIAWMGVDNMKMLAPVKIGDTITNHVETVEKRETSKPTQGLQTWRYTVKNQREESVMVFDMKFLMYRKPSGA